jgi:L-asparaginase
MAKALPRIGIVVTGGTITMTPQAGGGIAPEVSGEDLLRAVPDLASSVEMRVSTPFLKPGPSLDAGDLATVIETVDRALAEGCAGVVVVQGTDTIDEVAFLLDLLHERPEPVVVTGAMRGAAAPGADGPANLRAAVTVAAAPAARGLGVLVVLNDTAHAALHVVKSHTVSPAAFTSPDAGPVGHLVEGEFRVRARPLRPTPPGLRDLPGVAPVAIVQSGLLDDGRILGALHDLGYAACVLVAAGAGHVSPAVAEAAGTLVGTMPVVLATRVPAGPVFTRTYGYPGSEIDLIRRGLIPAGFLPPHKARLLLGMLCGEGAQRDAIASAFERYS